MHEGRAGFACFSRMQRCPSPGIRFHFHQNHLPKSFIMSENSTTPLLEAKPSRLRKWGKRLLKTLAVLAAIFALVHAEEYWRGNRAYDRALADWKAAGLPTAEAFFVNSPAVPPENNLLDAPFFATWKLTNQEAQRLRPERLEKWSK